MNVPSRQRFSRFGPGLPAASGTLRPATDVVASRAKRGMRWPLAPGGSARGAGWGRRTRARSRSRPVGRSRRREREPAVGTIGRRRRRHSTRRKSRVTNAYKTLNTELGLPTQPVRPSEFVPRLASELGISDAIRRRAVALSKHHQETTISNGGRPSGVAAACIYKPVQEHGRSLTQQRVADAAGMSAVTVRARRDEPNAV
jgi:hypothetical protein